jgi:hypothetical protein
MIKHVEIHYVTSLNKKYNVSQKKCKGQKVIMGAKPKLYCGHKKKKKTLL